MEIRRQTERSLRFFLEVQVQCCQRRPEPERSCCQQHVLNGWVDRRPGGSGRCSAFEAGNDPHGGFVDVVGEIFRRRQHPFKPLPAGARGRFTSPDIVAQLLVSRTLVHKAPTVSLTFGSRTTRKRQRCHISAARGTGARFKDLCGSVRLAPGLVSAVASTGLSGLSRTGRRGAGLDQARCSRAIDFSPIQLTLRSSSRLLCVLLGRKPG
jgi:hypothetical protein